MMSEGLLMWILGMVIAWQVFLTERMIRTSIIVATMKAVMVTMSENAAKVLHSPHTPELDALLEKYIDRHYEMSWAEWTRLMEMCCDIIHDDKLTKQERALASIIHAVCRHKLHMPPDKFASKPAS